MKDLGAPIKFNRQGYYYGDDGNFVISFMDNDSKSENVTAIDKMQKSRNGVTKGELEQLKEKASLDYDTLAKGLAVSRATLINKKGNDKFTPEISEKIVGLVDVYAYGYQVFGDVDRFNAWMFRPNQALNGEAPFDFVDNQFGREEIKNLIGRIENGVYS